MKLLIVHKLLQIGGGEESRTPVQYLFHTYFYECSLLLNFLYFNINKQTLK